MRRVCWAICGVLGLLAVVLAAGPAWAEPSPRRPNVLFIISDDLTAETLSCYGSRQCRTPSIDALAARGVRFTRAYCQFPVCGPARASLMSGMYPQSVGVTDNRAASRLERNLGSRPSMAQLFKEAGWHTARISKIYHMRVPGDITAGVDGPDHAASWSERFNCQGPEWMTPGEAEHLTNERLNFDPDKHYGLGFGTAFYVVRDPTDGAAQADMKAADRACALLREKRDEPFFLAVGLVRPHVPLVAPETHFAPYPAAEMTLYENVADDQADIPRVGRRGSSHHRGLAGKPANQRKVLSGYYASVAFMDAQVGRILDTLDELQLTDETIVVFTSDHGYHLGEHDLWQKMSLHEPSARIPLVISAPGIPATETGALCEAIDLYPTLAELAGLDAPEHLQGVSLAPVMRNPAARVRDDAYCFRGNGHLLRTDRWSYIRYRDGSEELYDMRNDPQQFHNLADDPERAGTRDALRKRLEARLPPVRSD